MKNITVIAAFLWGLAIISLGCDTYIIPQYLIASEEISIDSLSSIQKIVYHAEKQPDLHCTYDGSYRSMKYPGGDIERSKGVCTDVVIRSLRAGDIDLQRLIHEDMKMNLSVYNKRYRTKVVDANIDHRRTQNIQTYLSKFGVTKLDVSKMSPKDFKPGDIVFWDIAAGHTGIVVTTKTYDDENHLVVHNIGRGPQFEDLLSYWTPMEVYRLSNVNIKKMQLNSRYKHNFKTDPYFTDYE
jgi:uncharacterized protein YijF (DUF1287 family)